METEAIQATVQSQDRMVKSASEVKAQMALIADILKNVMQDGSDYGVVPGCGDKPSLLKPGAEKLCVAFRIATELSVEDLSGTTEDGIRHKTYRVKCRGVHIGTGQTLAEGIGEASTLEDKWAWRAALEEEYDAALDTHRRLKWKKTWSKLANAGKGANISDGAIKQIRTNAEDMCNTVLKMAKKRAQVDMTLSATGASAIFTQDIEEMPPEHRPAPKAPQTPPVQRTPQKASNPQPKAESSKEVNSGPPGDQAIADSEQQQQMGSAVGTADEQTPDSGGSDLPLGEQDAVNWESLIRLRDAVVASGHDETKFWLAATASKDPKYPAFKSESACISKIIMAAEKNWKTTFVYIWLRQAQEAFLGEEEGKLIGSFSKQGVKLPQLEAYLGKALFNLDDSEVSDLWNLYKEVKDGTPFDKAVSGE